MVSRPAPVAATVRANRTSPPALAPGAAVLGWAGVLVGLNLTADPVVGAATFAGLAACAWRVGMRRLLVVALLVGVGMLLVVPGVAWVDGSLAFASADAFRAPRTPGEAAAVIGAALRVPAQVLAAVLLLLVPPHLLLAAAGRLSPRGALLAGLAARLQPLLARDLRAVRDELASRGLRTTAPAPIGERVRGAFAVWEATLSGVLDRSFATAAALETRGFGRARPTLGPLTDPRLGGDVAGRAPAPSWCAPVVAIAASAFVVGVVAARASGLASAPALGFGASAAATPAASGSVSLLLGLLGALVGAAPAIAGGRAGTPARSSGAADRSSRSHPGGVTSSGGGLTMRRVGLRYPGSDAPALVDVDLDAAAGELVVIAGASGSGKSSLLDVVSGVAPHTTGGSRSGEIRVGAHVLHHAGDGRGRVAAVFQHPEGQVLVGVVAEEVAFGLRHAGVPAAELSARVVEALVELDVLHLAARDCSTLSGGELQRVLLAAALALRPEVLVLDEPTSQVDAACERRFWDAVDRVRSARGITVLAAEHRLDHVLHRADRVVVVAGGRAVQSMLPGDLATSAPELLASPYDGLAPALPDVTAGVVPAQLAVHLDRLDVAGARPGEPPRTLLRGLHVAMPPRAVVTLEGPNGTGKTTLLRALRGLHPGDARVAVDGAPLGDVGSSVRAFAYLAQGAGALVPGRTVAAASEDTCRRLGIHPSAARSALMAAGLADRLDAHPTELSVGERQRLALVAATAHRPPVWLLDEPTRGMDPAARRWVACHVLAHAAAGGVVVLATHDPALAAAVATHRLRLDLRTGPSLVPVARDATGRVVADGTWSEPHVAARRALEVVR